jgi:hypothetical protein
MTRRQIRALLLSAQSVVYLFGALCGSLLGVGLATAMLPFLQFSGSGQDRATLGELPYMLSFDSHHVAIFYATLLVAFIAALGRARRELVGSIAGGHWQGAPHRGRLNAASWGAGFPRARRRAPIATGRRFPRLSGLRGPP